ncbi:VOC family protein [Sphingomonas sp. AP4-R1]|uniref:VOC family protein n=1 Tax=Sphingomonas sp. AP4-R1 TaxID=2735134 RepID=UPI00149344A3|nr:VOC family protein [Sphingomonas sp. AP4-R1]QJU58170.1 VOC family protein [Sphingomonas sp. AP4-R1]
MATVNREMELASGRGSVVPSAALSRLVAGTLVTTDLIRARHFYTEFFGMECVQYAPGRMLARDRRSKYLMTRTAHDFFVLDVLQVPSIERPQAMVNHWGFSVGSEVEVDRVRAAALARGEELGIKTIHPTTKMHGSYGFYFIDADDNWWEVEFRRGMTHDLLFSHGDFDAENRESFPIINPPLEIAETKRAIIGDEAFFTHGTTAVADCTDCRPFYEQVLGLRTVRHSRQANLFAGGSDFGVVGVGAGLRIQDQLPDNRFIVLVEGDEALRALQERVQETADTFGVQQITEIEPGEFGGNFFRLRTRDQIWFEISTRTPESYVAVFDNI